MLKIKTQTSFCSLFSFIKKTKILRKEKEKQVCMQTKPVEQVWSLWRQVFWFQLNVIRLALKTRKVFIIVILNWNAFEATSSKKRWKNLTKYLKGGKNLYFTFSQVIINSHFLKVQKSKNTAFQNLSHFTFKALLT